VLHARKDLAGAAGGSSARPSASTPGYAPAHNNLGKVLYDRKDLAGAEREYRQAIRLAPKLALPHHNLGIVFATGRTWLARRRRFAQAIRLDPKLVTAHCNLGWVLQQKGDLDGAVVAYKRVLQIQPEHPYTLVNLPRAERMRQLLPRMPDVLAGKDAPKDPGRGVRLRRPLRGAVPGALRRSRPVVRAGVRR